MNTKISEANQVLREMEAGAVAMLPDPAPEVIRNWAQRLRAALPQPAELAGQQGDLVNPNDCESGPAGEWYCEAHPDALMGHGGCGGAGIPAGARLRLALNWLRLERQKVRELHAQYGHLAEVALAATGKQQVGEVQGDALAKAVASLEHSFTFGRDYRGDDIRIVLDALAVGGQAR